MGGTSWFGYEIPSSPELFPTPTGRSEAGPSPLNPFEGPLHHTGEGFYREPTPSPTRQLERAQFEVNEAMFVRKPSLIVSAVPELV